MSTNDAAGRRTSLALIWAMSIVIASLLSSRADPPAPSGRSQLTIQARLTSAAGQPLSGTHALTFHICDAATGGQRLWTETQQVEVRNGIVSVALGRETPLQTAVFDPAGGEGRYVAIELAGEELARLELTATAYSVVASVANAVWDAQSSTGLDLQALDARYVQTGGSGGGVLRTLNGVAPTSEGDFAITSGPSGTVVVTPTTSGVQLDAQAGLEEATADGRYVNVTGDTVTGDLNVSGAVSAGSLQVSNQTTSHTVRASVLEFDAGNGGRMTSDNGQFSFGQSGGGGPNIQLVLSGQPANFFHVGVHANMLVSGRLAAQGLFEANGGLIVPSGMPKAFYHDLGDGTGIYYYSLEGPQSTNFVRGEGRLEAGVAVIDLPGHFDVVTEREGATAHVTALGPTTGLYVARVDDRQLEIRESPGGTGDVRFHYLVLGVRVGHANEQAIRPAPGR